MSLPFFSAAKEYIVLGGQHFVKALQLLRERKLAEMMDKDPRLLPPSLQYVEAEVLNLGCPLGLRATLAGQHQKRQSLTEACTLSDFFKVVVDASLAKKHLALAQQPQPNTHTDRCVFQDDEIGVLLERSGMKLDDQVEEDKSSIAAKKDDVYKAAKSKVCFPFSTDIDRKVFYRHR